MDTGDVHVVIKHSEQSEDTQDLIKKKLESPKRPLSECKLPLIVEDIESAVADESVNNKETSKIDFVKVFIQRDYSVEPLIKFQNKFPKDLDGKIEKEIVEATINKLNSYFAEPESTSCYTCTDGCLACLTAHLIYIFKPTPYEKCLEKVSRYVAEQNVKEYEPRGLKLSDPSLRGLRMLEICSL